MKITVNDEKYLNYSKYKELKGYFGTNKKNMPEYVKLSDIFSKTDINEEDKKTYDSAFSELLRHINHGHVFYNYNKEGCWYISYILHKEVEHVLKQDYNSYVYKLLKEFILKYNEYNSSSSDRCINDFFYINSDTYKIMNALYTLYDEYTNNKPIYDKTIPHNCAKFSKFLYSYNNFLNNYVSGTDFFNKILKHFDTEVRKTALKYKIYECREYPYEVGQLNLYTPPKPEQPIDPVPVEQHQALNVLERTGLQNSHHDVAHPPVTQLGEVRREEVEHENQVAEGKQETTLGHEITRNNVIPPEQGRVFKPEGAHKTERSHEHGIPQGYRRTYIQGKEGESFRAGLSPYPQDFATPDSSVQQELSYVSPFSQKSEPQKEDEGFMANMRNTITGVLGEVDPVPVVGVSGGMGALFLLFRYTPVGAFFRGGRGRVRRIPSGFYGQFPGGFPGYEDYEGGYIGYGPMNPLAE